jgi:hypothetical protein
MRLPWHSPSPRRRERESSRHQLLDRTDTKVRHSEPREADQAGIAKPGSISTSKTSQTTVTGETFGGGCTGSGPDLAINSKSVKCDKHTPGLPSSNTACTPGNYGYGSWANYASSGASTIQRATKKLSFTVNGVTYKTKTTSATAVGCAGGEAGFKVVGTITSPKAQKSQPPPLPPAWVQ